MVIAMQLRQTGVYPGSPGELNSIWKCRNASVRICHVAIVPFESISRPCRHIEWIKHSPVISLPSTQQWHSGTRWWQLSTCIGIQLHTKLCGSTPWPGAKLRIGPLWNSPMNGLSAPMNCCVFAHTRVTVARSSPAHHMCTDTGRVRKTRTETNIYIPGRANYPRNNALARKRFHWCHCTGEQTRTFTLFFIFMVMPSPET